MKASTKNKILLTGGNGMLGKTILRLAEDKPEIEIIAPTRNELDLKDKKAVFNFLKSNDFDFIIHAAAKVGGIKANIADPTGFLLDNMIINTNIIEAAFTNNIKKMIFLGSSCMYPKDYINPLKENYILAEKLEPTNEGYALSKITGAKLCEAISKQYGFYYKTLIPCNLYGKNDHFDATRGHLIASAILKIHNAKENNEEYVEIWGDGTAKREFLYIDDLAEFILETPDFIENMPSFVNVGLGRDYTVTEYYQTIADVIGFKGKFMYNKNAPVGMMQKLMDSSLAHKLGFKPKTTLTEGIKATYSSFLSNR